MKVEVLCATMHQNDLSNYSKMNIQTDVVFANQADCHDYREEIIDSNNIKMITTPFRGVGKNRNLALLYCSGDILMFSDDDLKYSTGYKDGVIDAFNELPDADMIIFNCKSNREQNNIKEISRAKVWNSMKFGTYCFVIKRKSLQKNNLIFSHLFGGGSRYSSGEDNLFLREAFRKKLKIYIHPYTIAQVNHGKSTWFEGYTEKYIFDHGAMIEAGFPLIKHIVIWHFVFKFSKLSGFGFYKTFKLEYEGMRAFKKGISYDEWRKM